MYELTVKSDFASSHSLREYDGKCKNLHGHTWKVDITIETDSLVNDMVVDFKELKTIIDDTFDHKYINDEVSYNPTAENIAQDIYKIVRDIYYGQAPKDQDRPEPKISIRLWESDTASILYTE